MNQFIQSNLSTFYLWYDEIPNIKPESKKDPKEYFKVLLSSKDKWSLITDDANGLLEEKDYEKNKAKRAAGIKGNSCRSFFDRNSMLQ